MAEIYLDSAMIEAAMNELEQVKEIIDLQCNKLYEVKKLVESGWQCSDTARLCKCIEHTRSRLRNTGSAFKGIAGDLQAALAEAKRIDTLNKYGFGGGNGGGIR